ncbi:hypothetical protein BDR04DRAFT_213725 [Suillus decipiens]|nr:hypothetical protein BDR04DRAFT_213725 [Suillus decipiens]
MSIIAHVFLPLTSAGSDRAPCKSGGLRTPTHMVHCTVDTLSLSLYLTVVAVSQSRTWFCFVSCVSSVFLVWPRLVSTPASLVHCESLDSLPH